VSGFYLKTLRITKNTQHHCFVMSLLVIFGHVADVTVGGVDVVDSK
jgi:hypothetical protein